MPEIEGQTPAPMPTAEEVAAQNAAVAAKLAAQDAAGNPRPDPLEQKTAGDALDALAKQVEDKSKAEADAPEPEPKAATTPEVTPKAEPTAEEKAASEAAATAKADELKKADELFKDSPTLPQGASVKSHEAFSTIKVKAAQEISKLSSELETLKKEYEAAKAAQGKPSPEQEQLAKEAEELRKWRAKMDVEFDPKFKEFDREAEQGRDFIYSQLRKSGAVTEATIDKIKALGGPDKVNMKPVMDVLNDTTSQRLVEASLADIEKAKYRREQAVAQTKENITQYMTERQQELSKASTTSVEDTRKELDGMWASLPWTKPQAAKQGATDAEKTAVENHNKFVESTRQQLEASLADNSPKMKATLLAGVAQLFNLQGAHAALKESHEKLSKEVEELRAFKDKVKNASRSRVPESQAPRAGAATLQKQTNIFTTPATSGLDAIAAQVMAERAAKAGQA